MQEETKSQQSRIRWKFYHILLMLVPGVLFLTLYPGHYTEELQRAARAISNNPDSCSPGLVPGYSRFVAGVSAGIYMVAGMILAAVLVSSNQPTRRQTIRKASLALAFMTVVNIGLCAGGCAFGYYVNQSLEEAVGRIKRTPLPQRTIPPAPAAQKP